MEEKIKKQSAEQLLLLISSMRPFNFSHFIQCGWMFS